MSLTDSKVKTAKAGDKPYKLTDGGGMYLLVKPNGSKYWQYRFRINAKQGTYQIGAYPDISLKAAREEHQLAREKVVQGYNPTELKQERKAIINADTYRFSYYFEQWLSKQNLAPSTLKDLKLRVKKNLAPFLDKKKIDGFSTLDLLKIVQRISDRGARETAKRMARLLRQVFNQVLLLHIIDNNPATGLIDLLPKVDSNKKKNFAHINKESDFKQFLEVLNQVRPRQDYAVYMALKFMPLVFLRPGNVRFLKWQYIDLKNQKIVIPASEMKRNIEHTVPLSYQAVDILKEIKQLTGDGEYVFTTSRGNGKPMSENTTTKAIQTLINPVTNEAYGKEFMTSHGFRHTASTLLNERGYAADVIELQLAHLNKDSIRATYNKAEMMNKRIEMMQEWADYLEGLTINKRNDENFRK